MADMQAVVVIHGMGEQIPMDTIKGFVDAVWQKDDAITANGLPNPTEVWSKPDARTGSLELRRITTAREHRESTGISQRGANRFLRAVLGRPHRWRDLGLAEVLGHWLALPAAQARTA